MWQDELSEEDIERTLNENGPPTIRAPEPSDRANKVATWLADPSVMLDDLTGSLNLMLQHCRWRYFDRQVCELVPEEFKKANLLDVWIRWGFSQDAEQLAIRNSIESTPFPVNAIREVQRQFDVCISEFGHGNPISLATAHTFTDGIYEYEYHLQLLADWIESRAIFRGQKAKQTERQVTTASRQEIRDAAFAVLRKTGKPPTKELVGTYLREEMGKTVSNNTLHITLREWRKEIQKTGPQ